MAASLKELHHSIERTFDLLLYLLNLPAELKQQGELRIEEAGKKQLPGEDDKNPSRKFVDNRVIAKLMASEKLTKLSEARKISWSDQQESIARFYKSMRESDVYKEYMSNGKSSYADDREMITAIFKNLLPKFDLFRHQFQEKSIYWDEEDFDYASYLVVNLLKKVSEPKLIDNQLIAVKENKDDIEFIEKLFKKTIAENEENERLITEKAKNWDLERIAFIDMILMKMAITEIVTFNQIPVKVSMNEYIDISKSFSSPKSGQFINGIIDKVIQELKEQKKFKKVGRGLLD
jgi:N utilization substance protein B